MRTSDREISRAYAAARKAHSAAADALRGQLILFRALSALLDASSSEGGVTEADRMAARAALERAEAGSPMELSDDDEDRIEDALE